MIINYAFLVATPKKDAGGDRTMAFRRAGKYLGLAAASGGVGIAALTGYDEGFRRSIYFWTQAAPIYGSSSNHLYPSFLPPEIIATAPSHIVLDHFFSALSIRGVQVQG